MKPLVVILLIAMSVQAQSLADAARKERERQAGLQPSRVIISIPDANSEPAKPSAEEGKSADAKPADTKTGETKPADAKDAPPAPSKELPKPQLPPPPDPLKIWNDQLDQIRAKIRALQDQEMALQLQQNQLTNQVYAPVTDPATKDQAQAQLGQNQQQLATVRTDLDQARKSLDALQLQGPPKK